MDETDVPGDGEPSELIAKSLLKLSDELPDHFATLRLAAGFVLGQASLIKSLQAQLDGKE